MCVGVSLSMCVGVGVGRCECGYEFEYGCVCVCGGVHPPEHCPQQPMCENVACFVCVCMLPTTTCVPLLLCQVAWLLSAYTSDSWLPSGEVQRCSRLLYLIRTAQIRAPPVARYVRSPCPKTSTASH